MARYPDRENVIAPYLKEHLGKDGPVRGSEWYDHNGRREPCPGQEA